MEQELKAVGTCSSLDAFLSTHNRWPSYEGIDQLSVDEMASTYFTPIPADLPPVERAARLKRQMHAEWGIAVARIGGTEPCAAILVELQRYIDGQVSLQELAGSNELPQPSTRVLEATLQREEFSR